MSEIRYVQQSVAYSTGNVADKYLLLNQNCKKIKIIILILLYRGYAQMLVWIETMNAL